MLNVLNYFTINLNSTLDINYYFIINNAGNETLYKTFEVHLN